MSSPADVDQNSGPQESSGDTFADSRLKVPRRRIIFASLIGTTIEFYDFYIYATAAVSVFPILFFITEDDGAALLASMATFGAASSRGRWVRCSSATSVTRWAVRPPWWGHC